MQLQKVFVLLCKPQYGHCVHSLSVGIMSCPSKVPFKFSLPFQRVKIEFMCKVLLKFMFSKKATQTDKNIAIDLTLTTWCQIISAQRFQFHMLGVGQEFSRRNALFWCHRLPMYENYFLGWSLDMTSTCLEHKTRIAQAESRIGKESYFLKGYTFMDM